MASNVKDVLRAAVSGVQGNYAFESFALLKDRFDRLRQGVRAREDCQKLLKGRGCRDTSVPGGPLPDVKSDAMEVTFDRIRNPQKRRVCQNLPTRVVLKESEVTLVRGMGAALLSGSEEYRYLVKTLGGEVHPLGTSA